MLYVSARSLRPTAKEGPLAVLFGGNIKTILKARCQWEGNQTKMAGVGVFLLVEELMLENRLATSKRKSLCFLAQNEMFKTSFHLSFNVLLKASQEKWLAVRKWYFPNVLTKTAFTTLTTKGVPLTRI